MRRTVSMVLLTAGLTAGGTGSLEKGGALGGLLK